MRYKRTTRILNDWLKAEGVPRKTYSIGYHESPKGERQQTKERHAGVENYWYPYQYSIATIRVGVDSYFPCISHGFAEQLANAAIVDGYSVHRTFFDNELSTLQISTTPAYTEPKVDESRYERKHA